jgi:hypothetical protein
MRKQVIVKVPTIEDWEKVVQKCLDNGVKWLLEEDTIMDTYWDNYKDQSCISVCCDGDYLQYGSEEGAKRHYSQYSIITAEEFLGGEYMFYNAIGNFRYKGYSVERLQNGNIMIYPQNITGSGETISQPKTNMNKLTSMLKRVLDPEAQTLYKAGYIDGNMALTAKGQEALNAILFTANKAELVKQAEEELKEEKENK